MGGRGGECSEGNISCSVASAFPSFDTLCPPCSSLTNFFVMLSVSFPRPPAPSPRLQPSAVSATPNGDPGGGKLRTQDANFRPDRTLERETTFSVFFLQDVRVPRRSVQVKEASPPDIAERRKCTLSTSRAPNVDFVGNREHKDGKF